MKFIRRLVAVVVLVLLVAFSYANPGAVTVSLYPLPFAADIPLFLIVIGTLIVGVVIGGIVTWPDMLRHRRLARRRRQRIEALESKLAEMQAPPPVQSTTGSALTRVSDKAA
ncbi:MAG: hypothetical protein CMM50_07720 [Rhodospirillaceae bacterium]|nr:hypothetical protein [Rhodospirillaceae bacterium]|tara:strand:- start:97 stop:432 length:336 start_codon:yes stop_codon:yes gene_type:complete